MFYNSYKHHRRSIRLKGYDYSQSGVYFVTICLKDTECLLGIIQNGKMILNGHGNIIHDEWNRTADIRNNVELDEFVIMPNHIHGIIVIKNDDNVGEYGIVGATGPVAPTNGPIVHAQKRLLPNSLGSIIGQFKSVVTKKIRKMGLPDLKWQRNYYEHIIRDENELNRIRKYIIENPLKWSDDKYNPDN